MTTDPLAVLAASNPVRELPPVAPASSLPCLSEHPPVSRAARPRRAKGLALRAAIAAGILAGGTALVLSDGSSGPGVDVAAAAYAATSAGNGVIEAEFIVRSGLPGVRRTAVIHRREWLEPSVGRRREQTIFPNGKVAWELATAPGSAETWVNANGPSSAGTIVRARIHKAPGEPIKSDGLALYRQLYQQRGVKVVGRERLDGRLLWKLEGATGWATHRTGGPLIAILGEVVLVDPHTYLPIVERQVDLTRPGHPTRIESRLVRYRHLPRTASSEHLVLLRTGRPGARR